LRGSGRPIGPVSWRAPGDFLDRGDRRFTKPALIAVGLEFDDRKILLLAGVVGPFPARQRDPFTIALTHPQGAVDPKSPFRDVQIDSADYRPLADRPPVAGDDARWRGGCEIAIAARRFGAAWPGGHRVTSWSGVGGKTSAPTACNNSGSTSA